MWAQLDESIEQALKDAEDKERKKRDNQKRGQLAKNATKALTKKDKRLKELELTPEQRLEVKIASNKQKLQTLPAEIGALAEKVKQFREANKEKFNESESLKTRMDAVLENIRNGGAPVSESDKKDKKKAKKLKKEMQKKEKALKKDCIPEAGQLIDMEKLLAGKRNELQKAEMLRKSMQKIQRKQVGGKPLVTEKEKKEASKKKEKEKKEIRKLKVSTF